jgi:hypothetical protein
MDKPDRNNGPLISFSSCKKRKGEKEGIPTVQAIDWEKQPLIPAERIDWSRQGEPLRVRPTWGSMVTAIGILISLIGAAAFMYWETRSHIASAQKHLRTDGIGWGVPAAFESRDDAKQARDEMIKQINERIYSETRKLRLEQQIATERILKEIKNGR